MEARLEIKERAIEGQMQSERLRFADEKRNATDTQQRVSQSDRQFSQLVEHIRKQRSQKFPAGSESVSRLNAQAEMLATLKAKARMQLEKVTQSSQRLQQLQKQVDMVGDLRRQLLRQKRGHEENLISEETIELKINQSRVEHVSNDATLQPGRDHDVQLHLDNSKNTPQQIEKGSDATIQGGSFQSDQSSLLLQTNTPQIDTTALLHQPINSAADFSSNLNKPSSSQMGKESELKPTVPLNQGMQAILREEQGVKTVDFSYLYQGHELRVQLVPDAKNGVTLNFDRDALLSPDQMRRALSSMRQELSSRGVKLTVQLASGLQDQP